MRSCIYCGKELEKGEVCDCAQSTVRRLKRESRQNNANAQNTQNTSNSYKTGYAGGESRFERAKQRAQVKRAAKSAQKMKNKNNASTGLWRYILEFLKSPVDAVINPMRMSIWAMLTIAAVQGAALWLCMFFLLRGGAIGPFRLLASLMTFGGGGYKLIASIAAWILSGAVGGVIIFFLYTGVFYLINRFIVRIKKPYWNFCERLAVTCMPFTIICIVGAALSILSPITLMTLVVCGAISFMALTYEALCAEWSAYPRGRVLYLMLLGSFVIFSVLSALLFI